jgi:hypothetical protein
MHALPCSVEGITEDHIEAAAQATEGFSGRELAKMVASIQTAVYGTSQAVLTPEIFHNVVQRMATPPPPCFSRLSSLPLGLVGFSKVLHTPACTNTLLHTQLGL